MTSLVYLSLLTKCTLSPNAISIGGGTFGCRPDSIAAQRSGKPEMVILEKRPNLALQISFPQEMGISFIFAVLSLEFFRKS